MTKRFITALAVLCLAGVSCAPAAAKTKHHHKKCYTVHLAKTLTKREHGKKVRIKVRYTKAICGAVTFKTSVDPSFTQSAADPLAVIYTYSADAVEIANGTATNLGEDGQLPDGILNFYSASSTGGPEELYCSIDVGGSRYQGTCPITYPTIGSYGVTTEYIPNAGSAVTEQETETINPFTTVTTVMVTPTICPVAGPEQPPADCYDLTASTLDQNGDAPPGDIVLAITPISGSAEALTGYTSVADGATCLVEVGDANGRGEINSPSCNGDITVDADNDVNQWSVTAAYQANAAGWAASTSSAVTFAGAS